MLAYAIAEPHHTATPFCCARMGRDAVNRTTQDHAQLAAVQFDEPSSARARIDGGNGEAERLISSLRFQNNASLECGSGV